MAINTPKKRLSTFQIIIFGFLAVIIIGTILLMLPISSQSGKATPIDEAAFTATSAVCVTGLVVHDTSTYWSYFGQGVILTLIEIGGLGIISIIAGFSLLAGRKISLMQRSTMQDAISAPQVGGIVKLTKFIIFAVLGFEAAGAIALMPTFCSHFGVKGIWLSVFHSISAFCNAGFDLMGQYSGEFSSLTFFANDWVVVTVISLLIIIGGIGFLTWDDFVTHKFRFKRFRMQSKVVLVTSFVLILIPFVVYFFTEYTDLSLSERFAASLFQAVTPRTAGFNTTDLSVMSPGSIGLMIGLMLTGGSPGSTAGGMKTTTVAVLFMNVISVFRSKRNVEMFGRRIEDNVIRMAATVITVYVSLASIGAIIISILEGLPIGTCLFETASAVGTVGLTLGITPGLGLFSRIILILLMYLGRVGSLTLVFAALKTKNADMSHSPVEKITVG